MTDIQDGQPSLTTEIADFTAGAVKRLPPHYLGAFEALVTRLACDGIGRNAPAIGAAFPDFALRTMPGAWSARVSAGLTGHWWSNSIAGAGAPIATSNSPPCSARAMPSRS